MVGSFFENLVIIKMSAVERVCCCLPAARPCPPPQASPQSRAEKGQGTLRGGGWQGALRPRPTVLSGGPRPVGLEALQGFFSHLTGQIPDNYVAKKYT